MVAAAWLSGQPPTLDSWWDRTEAERAQRAYQALVSLPETEQRRRMAAAREAALDCRTDALVALVAEEKP
jgi:hypothetical protein